MYERFPRTARVASTAVLGGLLIAGCGKAAAPGEKPDTPAIPTELTPPAVPTPSETRKLTLESREIVDGDKALVCNAIAAIINPDSTRRVIGRPIIWKEGTLAPVEILNMSSAGIKVEERTPLPTDWYNLDGKKITEDGVACTETPVFTQYNALNNNQVVTTVDTLPEKFRAGPGAIHDAILAQHDMGPYGEVEFEEFREALK